MSTVIKLIQSGFGLIDQNWGGVYRGGSYVLIGPRKSGRTLLGLQFAMEAAKNSEVCLYFTNMRPKDLMIQAASINFDIQSYMNQNMIIVVRVAPPHEIYESRDPDKYLVEYLNDIITVVNHYNPSRIVFDELTPYIGFRNVMLLREAFIHTLETIEDRDITSLFILGEPATQKAQNLVDTICNEVTGVIFLKKSAALIAGKYHGGVASIIPNVGHTEGQFSSEYIIEPFNGVTVNIPAPEPPMAPPHFEPSAKVPGAAPTPTMEPVKPADKTIESHPSMPENKGTPNVYNKNDFLLILNNQIALYKSTGQKFQVMAFKLDPIAQVTQKITKTDLMNAIKFATTKKEKVCELEDKILVMQVRPDPDHLVETIHNVAAGLRQYVPGAYNEAVEAVKIHFKEVNEGIDKAEDIMEEILLDKAQEETFYIPISKYLG